MCSNDFVMMFVIPTTLLGLVLFMVLFHQVQSLRAVVRELSERVANLTMRMHDAERQLRDAQTHQPVKEVTKRTPAPAPAPAAGTSVTQEVVEQVLARRGDTVIAPPIPMAPVVVPPVMEQTPAVPVPPVPVMVVTVPDVPAEPETIAEVAQVAFAEAQAAHAAHAAQVPPALPEVPPVEAGWKKHMPPHIHATGAPVAPHRPPITLEKLLGVYLPICLAALAIALGGIFLVKFSIENAWLSPAARVYIALAFGASLVGAGEWLRTRQNMIAQALAAAGVAVLFAGWVAGVHYPQEGPVFSHLVGFAGMAVTTALAVLMSIRFGPLVALLGLLGGFLTPVLVGSNENNTIGLLVYLTVLQWGLLVVAKQQKWWWLIALTMVGSLLWSLVYVAFLYHAGEAWLGGLFVLVSSVTFVLWSMGETSGPVVVLRALGMAQAVAGLLLVTLLIGREPLSLITWLYILLLGLGLQVLAIKQRMWWALVGLALVLTLLQVGITQPQGYMYGLVMTLVLALYVLLPGVWSWRESQPVGPALISAAASVLGVLVVIGMAEGAHIRLWPGMDLTPIVLLMLAVQAGLAYWQTRRGRRDLPWGGFAGLGVHGAYEAYLLAVGLLVVILGFAQWEWLAPAGTGRTPEYMYALLPVTVWLAAAGVLGWGQKYVRSYVTSGTAVALLGLSLVALGLLVGSYPAMEVQPTVLRTLGVFGPVAVLLVLAGMGWQRSTFWKSDRVLAGAWLGAGLVWVVVAVLPQMVAAAWYQLPGAERWWQWGLMQTVVMASLWWLTGMGVEALRRWYWPAWCARAGQAVVVVSVLPVAIWLLFVFNPLGWVTELSPRILVNEITLVYGVVAALWLVTAWRWTRRGVEAGATVVMGWAGLLMGLAGLWLDVRQLYHGGQLYVGAHGVELWNSEAGLVVMVTLTVATACLLLGQRWKTAWLTLWGEVWMWGGCMGAGALLLLGANPLVSDTPVVGGRIWNELFASYFITALVALGLAGMLLRRKIVAQGWLWPLAALVLVLPWAGVTLEVRHWFHPEHMMAMMGSVLQAEQYSYSLAWILLAAVWLVVGIVWNNTLARWASLGLMLIATGKVFIIDLAHLKDLYRVLSLVGLGFALLALAFFYQRFVFGKKGREGG